MRNSVIKTSSCASRTRFPNRNISPYDILSSRSMDKKYMFKSFLFRTNIEEERKIKRNNNNVFFSKQFYPNIPLSSRNRSKPKTTHSLNIRIINPQKVKQTSTASNIEKRSKDQELSKLIAIIANNNRKHLVIKGIDIKSRNNVSKPKKHMHHNSVNVLIKATSLNNKQV